MRVDDKYRVVFAVFFGGSTVIGEGLTIEEARTLQTEQYTDAYESCWIEIDPKHRNPNIVVPL